MDVAEPMDPILVQRDGPIATVIFNRPERRNAMNREMLHRLPPLMEELAADKELRVVVFRGAGDKAFMAGADLREYATWSEADARVHFQEVTRVHEAIERLPKPTIAMINGAATGGGLEVALDCDLRVAADHARFGIPIGRLGHTLDFRCARRALQYVGPSKLKMLLFTDRLLQADEALQVGLVDWVVPAAELESFTYDLARTIASKAPLGLRASKETIRRVLEDPTLSTITDNAELVAPLFNTRDFREGVTAFLEKRTPHFIGE